MTKKITAFLTAILCMASMTAMTAGAEVYDDHRVYYEYYEGDDDTIKYEHDFASLGLTIDTGGEVLTKDMIKHLLPENGEEVEDEKIQNWRMQFFDSFSVYNEEKFCGDFDVITDVNDDCYFICLEEVDDDDIREFGRRLMLEYDFIKDIQVVNSKWVSGNALKFLSLEGFFTEEDFDVEKLLEIPELKDFYCYKNSGKYFRLDLRLPEWDQQQDMVEWWMGLSAEELPDFYNEFHAANPQYSDGRLEIDVDVISQRTNHASFKSYQYMLDFCNSVAEQYPDVFEVLVPLMEIEGGHHGEGHAYSEILWDEYVGDTNTDGEVDAADAADVLVIAAQNGTGAGIKATSANDVNADGYVDASDAAAVLSYAAAKGTGADVSWVDILRK